jgi:hypothetical protein
MRLALLGCLHVTAEHRSPAPSMFCQVRAGLSPLDVAYVRIWRISGNASSMDRVSATTSSVE